MRVSLLMVSMCLALPYTGRADQPPAAAPAAVSAAAAESTAAAAATTTTTTAAPPTDVPAAEKTPAQLKMEAAEAKIRKTGANGYKPETTKSGDVLYCKRETPMGTHFETKQCRTFEQLRDEALRGQDFLQQMQRSVPPNKG